MEEQILQWLGDYCAGQLNERDAVELRRWLDTCDANKKAFSRMVGKVRVYGALCAAEGIDGEAFRTLLRRIARRRRRRTIRLTGIAAASAACLALLAYYTAIRHSPSEEFYLITQIAPGTTKATLELPEGISIDLTRSNLGEIAGLSDEFTVDSTAGSLRYDNAAASPEEPRLHTLTVPVGGEYNLTLSDGTRVWVNSDSKLIFPARFAGDSRRVQVEGEAYFDVTHDAGRPFIVSVADGNVRVHGTRFCVSAYRDNNHFTTTLEEGKVTVDYQGRQVALTPGRQAVADRSSGTLTENAVETSLYTSWVRGVFEYENMPLSQIVVQLSRWYDVRFEFDSPEYMDRRFTGVAVKYDHLEKTLDAIQKTTDVRFLIKDRTVRVGRPNKDIKH